MGIRVLEIFREPIANGGQESFIMNMYRNMNHEFVQLDFLTPFTCDNEEIKQEIEALGGRVYHYDHPFGVNNNKVFRESVKDFLSKNHYDTVHYHSGSTYALMEGSKIACEAGVKNVIVHSHCGGFDNIKYRMIKTLSVPYLLRYPTAYFACSNLAAEWKFPKRIIRNKEYKVIKNAIDVEKFFYNERERREYREELGLKDEFVVGHIGRFATQKNHKFIVQVFSEILKKKKAKLILVGDGELRQQIEQQIDELGIRDDVLMLGLRKDIPGLMNAMDALLMPSFFEGLPVVGVEAQATGLLTFFSENIAHELPIPELSHYIDLDKSAAYWADYMIEHSEHYKRRNTTAEIIQQGYEIKTAAAQFQKYYMDMNR